MMKDFEKILDCTCTPKSRAGLCEVVCERVLSAYDAQRPHSITLFRFRWIAGSIVSLTFCAVVFLGIYNLRQRAETKRDLGEMTQETKSIEQDISQDPVFAEVSQAQQ